MQDIGVCPTIGKGILVASAMRRTGPGVPMPDLGVCHFISIGRLLVVRLKISGLRSILGITRRSWSISIISSWCCPPIVIVSR